MDELKTGTALRVCWIGNPRYAYPLNPTDEKKWRLLRQLGMEMAVIAFATGVRPRRFTQHAHFYLLSALPISVLRYVEMFLVSPLLLLWLILHHRVQVIVAQSPYEGAIGALTKNLASLFGRRVALIVEHHGDFENVVFMQRQIALAGLYRCLMGVAARYALRHADVLRAVASKGEEQLRAYAPHTPVHRFMAWTDSAVFRDTVHQEGLARAQDLVYVGVLIPRKGVHLLIEAFARVAAQFPDSILWLVGKPENQDYAAALEEQTEQCGLVPRVRFVGHVSQGEVAGYLGRARVMVLPSFSEGLPRVVVEAMLCGTPVIATSVDGIPEVIQDGVNGYMVPPGDVDALAARLSDILRDPGIDAMGQRARACAEQVFSEAAYLEGYRRLLEAAVRTLRQQEADQ